MTVGKEGNLCFDVIMETKFNTKIMDTERARTKTIRFITGMNWR